MEWWEAVELGARGRYAQAWAGLEPLAARGSSLAASTLGSHHRQLGRHAAGREWDERALALASDTEALVEALLGLTADAVGLGETSVARARLTEALRARGDDDRWRIRVRSGWVRAEVALLAGEPAREPAREALAIAEAAGSQRHIAKSLLFVAVSDPTEALGALRRSWELSTALGYETLVWPAGGLLLDLGAGDEVRARMIDAVRAISGNLPEDIARAWASRWDSLTSR